MPRGTARRHGVKTTFEGGKHLLRAAVATRYAVSMATLDLELPETDLYTEEESAPAPVCFSLGIMAWNEEKTIPAALASLFQQSVFGMLAARGERAEIVVIPNGCTDATATVAEEALEYFRHSHPHADAFVARVCEIEQPGRHNAWNRFVHEYSAREARFIFLMDADILFCGQDTLRNMVWAIEREREAMVVTDRAVKEIESKPRKTWRDRLSLATSAMNRTNSACFTGQLYGMRSEVARNLYLPRDAGAPDDGFFKQVICTDFLTRPVNPRRIVTAPEAAHVFEAYTSIGEVLRNQRRQMMGQTTVHVLIEYLKTRPHAERVNLAATLRREDTRDPAWLRRLLGRHVAQATFFWQLFPGILTFRLKRCWALGGWKRFTYLPAALAATGVTVITCFQAHRALRKGNTHYWPKPSRGALLNKQAAG